MKLFLISILKAVFLVNAIVFFIIVMNENSAQFIGIIEFSLIAWMGSFFAILKLEEN